MYVPPVYETIGWIIIFLLSVALISHGGTTEKASEELDEKIEDIE